MTGVLRMTKEQRRNAPLAFLAQHRAEMAEIARAKLRQGRAKGLAEPLVELLADWAAGFVQ